MNRDSTNTGHKKFPKSNVGEQTAGRWATERVDAKSIRKTA